MFSKFIGGNSIKIAIKRCKRFSFTPIFDYARESSKTEQDSLNYIKRLQEDVKYFPSGSAIGLKNSSFAGNNIHLIYTIKNVLKAGVHTVFLDAESESNHINECLAYNKALQVFNQNDVICYKTYQMYRIDSNKELLNDMSDFSKLGIKLVRGSYYRQDACTGSLYKNKQHTDTSYDDAVKTVITDIKSGSQHRLVIATHNDKSIDKALCFDPPKDRIAFAQLLGMNDRASRQLSALGYKVYKYVPYGDITETYPYLLRRLYENIDVLSHLNR